MARSVHVHLHATRDQEFKRDKDGKFATTGSAGGNAAHHHLRMEHHRSEQAKKGTDHPDHPAHGMAASSHQSARNALEYAESSNDPTFQRHRMGEAQHASNEADKHEAHIDGREVAQPHAGMLSTADMQEAAYKATGKNMSRQAAETWFMAQPKDVKERLASQAASKAKK